MFTYAFKNLKSMFTKQRLLSLLLVLNIVVSCLVICFSYGLYQNYNMIVIQGEEKDNDLSVLIDSESRIPPSEKTEEKIAADISPGMVIDMVKALSDDTKNNIKTVAVLFITESPISKDLTNLSLDEPNEYYSDDNDPFLLMLNLKFSISGDEFIDLWGNFTPEQYNSGEKIAIVTENLYGINNSFIVMFESFNVRWCLRKLTEGTDSFIIDGEKYEVVEKLRDEELEPNNICVPLTSLSDSAKVFPQNYDGGNTVRSCVYFSFNEPVTRSQYADLQSCIFYLGGDVYLEEIEFTEATEIYYYKTIMLISVVIAVLAAINMAILYRYILEKRSSELAIFRICGCSKGKAIMSYLLECMVINIPLFALTQLIYHKLIMPILTGLFPNMAGAYSVGLYAAIFGIYIGASMLIMLIMIIATIRKHSLVALKSAPKATSKFSIMKVFEVVQLAIVLSIMVLIVSAIVSRYELYKPFEQYFERQGYMVNTVGLDMWPEDFEEMIGDATCITNQFGGAQDGDLLSGDYTSLYGINYSDEFIDAYSPPLEDGIWLSDTDETYEKDGYIPAVITYCDGRYKVGDIIEADMLAADDNDQQYVSGHYKYKIIGVLKDKVSIASYQMTSNLGELMPNKDYRDIYNVFSDSFEEKDFLLAKISDNYACFDHHAPIDGIQFVFCDNMSYEEYEELGRKLNGGTFATVPLSEVRKNSLNYIYEQMYTLFPIAVCIFILTIISTVSISAIYTKRQLRNYAIFYICGARWRTCALKSLKNGAITCAVAAVLSALILIVGKSTLLKETVISFGMWHFAVCAGVIVLYLALSMIMPLSIIGSAEPREVLKEE